MLAVLALIDREGNLPPIVQPSRERSAQRFRPTTRKLRAGSAHRLHPPDCVARRLDP